MKNTKQQIFLPLIITTVLVTGIAIGAFFFPKTENKIYHVSGFSSPLPTKLAKTIRFLEENYVDTLNQKLMEETALQEMLKKLDPHSTYIPPQEAKVATEELEGSFDGIGVQFNMQNDTVFIITVISGGPAEKAGLLPGDKIVEINDSLFAGKHVNTNQIMANLKGKKGTKVKVGIKRTGYPDLLNFDIIRGKIPINSVDVAYMATPEIGYIKISRFASTTHNEFVESFRKLKADGARKLILDLRGNGGGYLSEAVHMADEFLDNNKMIVYMKGRARPIQEFRASEGGLCLNVQTAILIDSWSASASEILAGALQDNDKGIIIGRRSFGKGLVQEPLFFNDQSMARITTARYYTPTGRSIQRKYGTDDDYELDIIHRMQHGELLEADSVELVDSLKFTTPKGKIVYGGGGINPDIFVPIDTLEKNDFFTKLRANNSIYKYALLYTDQNMEQLKKLKSDDKIFSYWKSNDYLPALLSYTKSTAIPENDQLKRAEKYIRETFEAYVIRNILGEKAFFNYINQSDNVVQRAIKELHKE